MQYNEERALASAGAADICHHWISRGSNLYIRIISRSRFGSWWSMRKSRCRPTKAKPSMDDNLIIHGDNLHALKALLPRYAGKVKCIYIDPPYNTGNEGWCYNDNVRSPLMKEWVERGNPVDGEDMERHDKWLSMMWPRLQLLRELLTDDGVIFISIDDNEQHRLRALMDEIFGEENFVANIVWQKKYAASNDATCAYRRCTIL